jgi:hypothetical protein
MMHYKYLTPNWQLFLPRTICVAEFMDLRVRFMTPGVSPCVPFCFCVVNLACVCLFFLCTGVLTLSAPAPPFEELMILWDFFAAFGFHWNVLAVAAQICIVRDAVMKGSEHPKHILDHRKWPTLSARTVISMVINMIQKLPKVSLKSSS